MSARNFAPTALLIALFAAVALAAPPAVAEQAQAEGMTLRIVQITRLGDLSTETDFRAWFLPPQRFRIEGTMLFTSLGHKTETLIVNDGKTVTQLSKGFFGVQVLTMDVKSIQEALPGFTPDADWSPRAYKSFIAAAPEKKSLGKAEMDGVTVEGYELTGAGVPLPSNAQLFGLEPAVARVWLGADDGIVRKIEAEDAAGNVFLETRYTDVKVGVAIPEAKFTAELPEGVAPMDITQVFLDKLKSAAAPPEREEAPEGK